MTGFRPLTGISLFLLWQTTLFKNLGVTFSSPHGDFSFSIQLFDTEREYISCFRPLTGISLFLWKRFKKLYLKKDVFVPSRGFLFFYKEPITQTQKAPVFVPSRGFLFFYATKIVELLPVHSFRPLTGISLFL